MRHESHFIKSQHISFIENEILIPQDHVTKPYHQKTSSKHKRQTSPSNKSLTLSRNKLLLMRKKERRRGQKLDVTEDNGSSLLLDDVLCRKTGEKLNQLVIPLRFRPFVYNKL